MNHLTATEFVDALDGTLDERRMRHLDACPMCRTQIGNLRSALGPPRGRLGDSRRRWQLTGP